MAYCNLQDAARDSHGHIADLQAWHPDWIPVLAAEVEIMLLPAHIEAILWLRDYYVKYQHFPTLRFTVKALRERLNWPDFDSIELHMLFPQSPLKLMSYCAGLPKPPHCL